MMKSQEKVEQIDEMIDVFSKVITALTIIRDKDVSETQVLKDLGINKNTFRRVVFDMNWEDKSVVDGAAAFRDKFKDAIPTRNWAEDLFCDVMGLERAPSSCGKIPEDVTETMETLINECMTDDEKLIIKLLYKECSSLEDVAEVLGRSIERIRQKRSKIFMKLRSRNHKCYMCYGDSYWLSEHELRERIMQNTYIEKLNKELSRLDDLISYRKAILSGVPIPAREIALEDLNLSVRAYNCLFRAGCRTLGEVAAMTESQCMQIRNLGLVAFREVKDALKTHGYRFRKEEENVANEKD